MPEIIEIEVIYPEPEIQILEVATVLIVNQGGGGGGGGGLEGEFEDDSQGNPLLKIEDGGDDRWIRLYSQKP